MAQEFIQKIRLQILAGTTEDWTTGKYKNLILKENEPALNTTNGIIKYGDGINVWSNLPEHIITAAELYWKQL